MRLWVVGVVGMLVVTGCQGTPVGDAMIGSEKLSQMDDQYCQSIGAKPKTDAYVQCRMFKTSQRDQSHQLAFQRAAAGLQATGAQMQQNAYANRPINCTSTATGTWVGTINRVNTTCY